MASAGEHRRPVRPEFSRIEVAAFFGGVYERLQLLDQKESLSTRTKAWEDILREVNAVSSVGRTLDEIRKKWSNHKCNARRKGNLGVEATKILRASGGRPAAVPVLDRMEERVVEMLHETKNGSDSPYLDLPRKKLRKSDDNSVKEVHSSSDESQDSDSSPRPSSPPPPPPLPPPEDDRERKKSGLAFQVLQVQQQMVDAINKLVDVESKRLVAEEEIASILRSIYQ